MEIPRSFFKKGYLQITKIVYDNNYLFSFERRVGGQAFSFYAEILRVFSQ